MQLKVVFLVFIACSSVKAQQLGELWGVTKTGGQDNLGLVYKTSSDGSNQTVIYNFSTPFLGSFPGNEQNLKNNLVEFNGKMYGMTFSGGFNDAGVIFEYDPISNGYVEKIDLSDGIGSHPAGSLIVAGNNKLYGMTVMGGLNDKGVLFEFDPVANAYMKKVDFGANGESTPYGDLLQASNGKLYGMTTGGGALFEFDITTGAYETKTQIGGSPYGSLIEASNGKLLGMTSEGGENGLGIIFEYDIDLGTYIKKIDFTYDGGYGPLGSLTKGTNGKFNGMTSRGGIPNGGVLFEYDLNTNTYSKRIEFQGNNNGAGPNGNLVLAADGRLYWMTNHGFFEYDPDANNYIKRADFSNPNGQLYQGSFVQASNGKFYGMSGGGTHTEGLIFEFDPVSGSYIEKISLGLKINGSLPFGSLFQAINGMFYGTTTYGGLYGVGVLFEFDVKTLTYTKKFDFSPSKGILPQGQLLQIDNGMMYGLTVRGGDNDLGVLFEYNSITNTYSKLFNFSNPLGSYPGGTLLDYGDGKLYGITSITGRLFEFDIANNTYSEKYTFMDYDGQPPTGGLIKASNGKLYGMAVNGGGFLSDNGVLFEYDIQLNKYTKKVVLDGFNGSRPIGSLIQSSNGKLYGTTSLGGLNNKGVIFEYEIGSNSFVKKIDFDGSNGSNPWAGLIEAANSKMYGVTNQGGSNNVGVIFEYDPATNNFTKKIDFNNANGSMPLYSPLIQLREIQSILFTPLQTKTIGDAPFNLVVSASSGLPVTLSTYSDKVILNGSQVTMVKPGLLTIIAKQPGNKEFVQALSVAQSFCINPAKPIITVTDLNTDSPTLTSSNLEGNQWYLNGVAITGATSASFLAKESGSYTVKTTVDICSSELSAEQILVVTGDVENELNNELQLYPNPAKTEILVGLENFEKGSSIKVEIFDLNGRRTENKLGIGGKKLSFDIKHYSPGKYILKAAHGKENYSKPFIKE